MDHQNSKRFGRRSLFKGATTLATGTAVSALLETGCSTGSGSNATPREAIIVASDSNAIVETTSGKVRGYIRNGINAFRGIPYGGTTAGSARFLPPTKPAIRN